MSAELASRLVPSMTVMKENVTLYVNNKVALYAK